MNIYNTFEENMSDFFRALLPEDFEHSYCIFCKPSRYRHGLFNKGTMKVERCECGFIYNQRQPKQRVLNSFYEESDAMKTWSELKTSKDQQQKQDEKYGFALSFLKGNIKSICDIGCGVGYFLSKIPKDIERVGIDSHDESLKHAKKQGVVTHKIGVNDWLSKCKSEGKKFDCVSLWGVLEHVKDPIKVLKDCYSIINKGGYLISCVPNVDSAVVQRFWKECFTFQPVHLWYFNQKTLSKAYEEIGLSYVDSWTIEAEVRPLIKGSNGFGPYETIPSWLEERVMDDNIVKEMKKEIILKAQGYKIVSIGRKEWGISL